MVLIDIIFDMFICICNVCVVRYSIIQVFIIKMILSIVKVFKSEGFIEDYFEIGEGINKMLVFIFKYKGKIC